MKNILEHDLHVILLIIGTLMMIFSCFINDTVILGIVGCIVFGIYFIIDILWRYYKHEQIIKDLYNKEGDKND